MYRSISAGSSSIKKELDVFSEASSTYGASIYKLLCIPIELLTLQMLKQLHRKRLILVIEAGLAEIDLYTKFPIKIRKSRLFRDPRRYKDIQGGSEVTNMKRVLL